MGLAHARRTQCLNNVRQIGIAMLGFETANGFYAPSNSTGAGAMWPPNNPKEHGMFALLLPHLDNRLLLTMLGYDYERNWGASANRPAAQTVISTFACSSTPDGPRRIWADNAATFPLNGADPSTGVPNSSCYHTDATGRVPASGVTTGGQCVMNCSNWDEPYSFHPSGVNAVFGDGSVRFLADDLSPLTMIALVTRSGGDIASPP